MHPLNRFFTHLGTKKNINCVALGAVLNFFFFDKTLRITKLSQLDSVGGCGSTAAFARVQWEFGQKGSLALKSEIRQVCKLNSVL